MCSKKLPHGRILRVNGQTLGRGEKTAGGLDDILSSLGRREVGRWKDGGGKMEVEEGCGREVRGRWNRRSTTTQTDHKLVIPV